jgi:hypothetical protein
LTEKVIILDALNSASGVIHFHSGYLEILMGGWDTLEYQELAQSSDLSVQARRFEFSGGQALMTGQTFIPVTLLDITKQNDMTSMQSGQMASEVANGSPIARFEH